MVAARPDASTAPTPNRMATFTKDFFASLVVFLVAVPLALGIALASGAPIMSGLIGCAVGGIVAGLIGGAPLQVTGPAAGLTVIVFGIVQKYGWPTTCAITVGAGLLQLAFGGLRIARACLAISPAVVHGMLAGIGVVIALAQIHIVFGGSPQSSAWANLRELPGQIIGLHSPAALVGLLTIVILVVWQYVPKRLRSLPGALIAVVVSTLVANLFQMDVRFVELPANLMSAFTLPRIEGNDWGGIVTAVLTVGIVASVESLLCAVATDKLHSGPRANLDRELIGQGAANTLSGLVGGLPVTGVIVRSSANITAGAQTRWSAVMHGIWIVLFVALLGSLVERIPLSALAGLLVYVGVRLVNLHHIKELITRREAPVYFVTLLGVVFWNLLAGVGLGIGLAIILLLRRLSSTQIIVEEKSNRWHARISGTLTFLSVPQLTAALAAIPEGTTVDVDLVVDFMDHAAFEALHSWRVSHEKLGGRVDIDELHEIWYENAVNGTPKTERTAVPMPDGRTAKPARSG